MNSATTRCALMMENVGEIISTLKTLKWMRKIMQYSMNFSKTFFESVHFGGKRVKFRKQCGNASAFSFPEIFEEFVTKLGRRRHAIWEQSAGEADEGQRHFQPTRFLALSGCCHCVFAGRTTVVRVQSVRRSNCWCPFVPSRWTTSCAENFHHEAARK